MFTENPLMRTLLNLVWPVMLYEGDPEGPGENWRDSLPAEIKAHPVLEKYESKEAAIKALVDVQPLIGREKIPLPPENATDEDWAEVWNRLGRPDAPDKYDLSKAEVPEELNIQQEVVDKFRETAHKLGLLPQQVSGVYQFYIDHLKDQAADFDKFRDESKAESEAKLRKEWGRKYDENLALAQKVIQATADDDAVALLNEGLGNDPRLVKMFAKVGELISEDKLHGKPKSYLLTPEEAQKKINTIRGDPKHAYNNKDHPGHKEAVQEVEGLYAMAYPDEKTE